MPDQPTARSVKISPDERGGWSSERPRKEGERPRLVDISTRCRVLTPASRLRYSPGSLLLILCAAPAQAAQLTARVVEEHGAVLSLMKVRELLAGRVAQEDLPARAVELLDAAVAKRLGANQTVVIVMESLHASERERYARLAHAQHRPRHIALLEIPREQVPEEERPTLNELRRALDAGELGQEGFQTALRLSAAAAGELKRIVFQPPPRED
jgi:hypothetical protein